MNHPSSLVLEAFACGEESASVAPHLDACEACRSFVEKARALLASSVSEVDDFLGRAFASLEDAAPVVPVVPAVRAELEARPANDHGEQDEISPKTRRLWIVMSTIAMPLAVAAAVLLLVRGAPLPAPGDPGTSPTTTTPSPIPTETALAPGPAAEPDTTFKGAVQIAVVRDRAGQQTRFAGSVLVKSGDRLRVEVAIDREQAILGAVLGDDGSYLEIMPAGVRGPGTHYSERSARIDSRPTSGTILIGSPEAVARARATKRFEGVVSLRVEPEAGATP